MPDAQYDCIGEHYTEVADLPTGLLQEASMQALLGDISGLTVLDLACGTGSYTQKMVTEWGARRAVGVDISPLMIEIARRSTQDDSRVEFHVADCGQPFFMGQFDLALVRLSILTLERCLDHDELICGEWALNCPVYPIVY